METLEFTNEDRKHALQLAQKFKKIGEDFLRASESIVFILEHSHLSNFAQNLTNMRNDIVHNKPVSTKEKAFYADVVEDFLKKQKEPQASKDILAYIQRIYGKDNVKNGMLKSFLKRAHNNASSPIKRDSKRVGYYLYQS